MFLLEILSSLIPYHQQNRHGMSANIWSRVNNNVAAPPGGVSFRLSYAEWCYTCEK
jgi:hypothetical protein